MIRHLAVRLVLRAAVWLLDRLDPAGTATNDREDTWP